VKHKQRLAAAGWAIFGSAAWAQSSVEIFGVMDVHLNSARSGATRLTRLEDGGSAASRIGFRGSEELGGGWRARFMLEAGVTPGHRHGHHSRPFPGLHPPVLHRPERALGPRRDGPHVHAHVQCPVPRRSVRHEFAFSPTNLGYSTDGQPSLKAFAARGSNLVRYRLPEGQPWVLDLAYSFGEVPSPNSNNARLYGGTVGWNQKPFFMAYSVQNSTEGSAAAPWPRRAPAATRRWWPAGRPCLSCA
jgi:predicted porin